jgi:tight adherence protein C
MTTNFPFMLALIGGGVFGGGIALLVVGTLPAAPALGPALDRLYPATRRDTSPSVLGWLRRRIQVPRADLAILGRTPERYVVGLVFSALFSLFLPILVTAFLLVLGLGITPIVPAGGVVLGAVFGVMIAHQDVVSKAHAARDEFIRGMCTYLDLAATQVRGGHGPMESLERAVEICHGWVFDHIRGALIRANLQLTPPWNELKRLSLELNVVELGDLADIMRSAASEGAQVYQTLRAKADSLRDQIRTQQMEKAEVRTNKLDIPAAALILVLLVLMIYPFMARLFTQA